MKENAKDLLKGAATTGIGAAAGAGTYGIVGGVGVAAGGTAIGITLGPFILIGAGLGAVGYGIYRLGKKAGKSKSKR